MKLTLILIGKTDDDYIKSGYDEYINRLKRYISFKTVIIPALKNAKNLSVEQQKNDEGVLIEKQIQSSDFIVLLDEFGAEQRSVEFADFLQKRMNSGIKNLVFIVGGPYGFSEEIKKIANYKLSLSKLTFSHQMVRLFFMEQLYRAMTILKNEPYHHE